MAAWICYKCDAEISHKFCRENENSLTDVHKRLQQVPSSCWEPRNFLSYKLFIAAAYLAANCFNFLWNSNRADQEASTACLPKKLLMTKYAIIRKIWWYLNLIFVAVRSCSLKQHAYRFNFGEEGLTSTLWTPFKFYTEKQLRSEDLLWERHGFSFSLFKYGAVAKAFPRNHRIASHRIAYDRTFWEPIGFFSKKFWETS